MIISKLFGGLGNQMFIYATTKALALKSNQEFSFDLVTGFKDDYLFKRNFQLSLFPISIKEASHFFSFQYFGGKLLRKISRQAGICIPFINFKFISESRPFEYHKEYFDLSKKHSVYLEGYFQSYKYFDSIKGDILKDFSFTNNVIESALIESRIINNKDFTPIAVGIRRYQEMQGNYGDLSVLPSTYYFKAIQFIKDRVSNPKLIIFSEDVKWVKENLTFDIPVYYVNPKNDYMSAIQDLYLMSLCHHHIISNSTFYWWGAYLSKNDNMVIAPNNFLNKDCVLDNWIII